MLHIATHGFFIQDPQRRIENPLLRSGLALTGANLRAESRDAAAGSEGILTALEASNLDLWGTKLVTLSACDTGVGEIRNGEGVYGLRRAFFLAGAETLVMSLWPVSDYVTRELMTDYYAGLKRGLGRGDALRQAQLDHARAAGAASIRSTGPASSRRANGHRSTAADSLIPLHPPALISRPPTPTLATLRQGRRNVFGAAISDE